MAGVVEEQKCKCKCKCKCRLWWPSDLRPTSASDNLLLLLFGCSFPSSSSSSSAGSHDFVDLVVSFAASPNEIESRSLLQGALQAVNDNNLLLQKEQGRFSVVGCLMSHCRSGNGMGITTKGNDHIFERHGADQEATSIGGQNLVSSSDNRGLHQEDNERTCHDIGAPASDCHNYNTETVKEDYEKLFVKNETWIELSYGPSYLPSKNVKWVPKLHSMRMMGLLCSCDFHVIIYERPAYGALHYSLGLWTSPSLIDAQENCKLSLKKPKWVDCIERTSRVPDLHTVLSALNSASAAESSFWNMLPSNCQKRSTIVNKITGFFWHLFSLMAASVSTFLYLLLRFFHQFLGQWLLSFGSSVLRRSFKHAWRSFHVRCCQILYWPIYLLGSGFRPYKCVEYAHKAAILKHSMWIAVVVDILLGNIVGLALLTHVDVLCAWHLQFFNDITDSLLRTGCVWLMGVPAGFKLNTELAAMLGLISLNGIQVWSAIWFFLSPLLKYFVIGLAISAMLFGLTLTAALYLDVIFILTAHVSALHWLLSLLYSLQVQALASLWRIFRGRKWNPLRQRLDSYEYSVEQHVVVSLLFTPILLLLPTTSVFYTFFTILNTTIIFFCSLIEVVISLIHATPYAEIFFWLLGRQRFPSGIWFEILADLSNDTPNDMAFGSQRTQEVHQKYKQPEMMVSVLHINVASFFEIVKPHYKKVFSGVSFPFGTSAAYGVLSGKRIPSSLNTQMPATGSWMSIGLKQFWLVTYMSILELHDSYSIMKQWKKFPNSISLFLYK